LEEDAQKITIEAKTMVEKLKKEIALKEGLLIK